MKLQLIGHDERYVVEQSLMALFPGELPEYAPIAPEDTDWAVITLEQTAERGHVRVELTCRGKTARTCVAFTPAGTDFDREGQRRHAIGRCFFLAAREVLGSAPPWGMLTGVRPDKPVTWALAAGKTALQALQMMEEEYFVSPDRAALAVETGGVALRAARDLGKQDIAVYVGIPFCPTRCAYCSFVSQSVERSFALVPPYVDALVEEIRSGGKMVRETGLRVRSFYTGGGTPTTLSAEQMDRVLTAFEEAFDRSHCDEITVEAGRPDTITAEKLAVLKAHGVTRVSVNPQTMEDHVLRAIGRRHTAADIEAAMELVAGYGFPHVNMDLIAGLPADTPEGFRRSLDRCLAFGTDNVTVHTLALKKGSRILLEGLPIPGPEDVAAMLDYAAPALRKAGYSPYYLYRQKYMSGSFENTGWCRPGAECWYNVQIMSELCSILSFGAGGSTKMVEPGTNHIERVFNLKYPKEYTERPEKAAANQAAFAAFYESLKGAQ
ncbi:MAG: coproporphyrinogen dehydrogenase HemZ [Dysosmobacter sp.]|uniref:coproporphyrinogen dehydrogenase HemZ n=1 Tax=Dysosmobacter sp. TaxID=2591382 RepID=UPI00284959BE|nr:coproporphyrinogen dehydrogenase HemZ [Dysosmobacter sp.]MDR3983648.1 coproporphyrinogen dehydrogenase HemZ [Dysosmobacter sp.]